jgi:hypothetical protein
VLLSFLNSSVNDVRDRLKGRGRRESSRRANIRKQHN